MQPAAAEKPIQNAARFLADFIGASTSHSANHSKKGVVHGSKAGAEHV
jgi:hypothetical protein